MNQTLGKKYLSGFEQAIYFDDAIARVRLTPRSMLAKEEFKGLALKINRLFQENLLPQGYQSIAGALHDILLEKGLSLCVAESCSGGTLSQKIVENAGSSSYYKMGWVTYSNESKIAQLGVQKKTLEKYGAVSQECLKEMLVGALERGGTDLAIAISGIAGPTGGSKIKPIGTVFTGIAQNKGASGGLEKNKKAAKKTVFIILENYFWGNRKRVMNQAAQKALFMLLKFLEKNHRRI
jgi:PncC family amidohydrolase